MNVRWVLMTAKYLGNKKAHVDFGLKSIPLMRFNPKSRAINFKLQPWAMVGKVPSSSYCQKSLLLLIVSVLLLACLAYRSFEMLPSIEKA